MIWLLDMKHSNKSQFESIQKWMDKSQEQCRPIKASGKDCFRYAKVDNNIYFILRTTISGFCRDKWFVLY